MEEGNISRKELLPKLVLCMAGIVWLSTELFSVLKCLSSVSIRLLWLCICIAAICWGVWHWKKKSLAFSDLVNETRSYFRELTCLERIILLMVIAFGLLMGMLACIIVPNNWDSMTYHLARVANWIENRSVAYYPTNIPRQLYYSAFTEYIVLHICLLFRNDQFVNLVQWCGYIVCAAMIYKIMRGGLRVSRVWSLIPTLLFMLCPLAIAESVTTQVDLMASLWLLIFIWYVLQIGKSSLPLTDGENRKNILFCACSVAFGYLTKSSLCFMMLPFLFWLLVVCIWKKERCRSIMSSILLAVIVLLLLTAPGFIRNLESTGNILAYEQVSGNLMTETANPKLLMLNVCKNLSLELGGTGDIVWKGTMWLADKLSVDIEDSRISAYVGFAEKKGCVLSYHHDTAGARALFIAFLIFGIYAGFCLIRKLIKREKPIIREKLLFSFVCICGAAALVMFITIRWQPWGVRILLPTLPMLVIIMGYILSNISKQSRIIYIGIFFILLMLPDATIAVQRQYHNYAEPALRQEERFTLYFKNRQICLEPYTEIVEKVREMGASDIGLLLSGDTYEYPLWTALKNEDTHLHHVVLAEENSETLQWQPEVIIAVNAGNNTDAILDYGGREYHSVWRFEDDVNYYSIWAL